LSLQFLVSVPPPLIPIISTPTPSSFLEFCHSLATSAFATAAATLTIAIFQLPPFPSSVYVNSFDHSTNDKDQK
jgi:hypothetical protein